SFHHEIQLSGPFFSLGSGCCAERVRCSQGECMRPFLGILGALLAVYSVAVTPVLSQSSIGREVSIARHLQDGEEFSASLRELLAHGQRLFTAVWTTDEGGGRPLTKGTGNLLSDPG